MERRGRPRRRKKYNSATSVGEDEKWTVEERQKLLSALQRYPISNTVQISEHIGTKTPGEVEKMIRKIQGISHLKDAKLGVGSDITKKAPIERWIILLQEMVFYEKTNYSDFIPKLFSTIAKGEQFDDTEFGQQLQWRNVYQFFTDILEEKEQLQSLTDLESLVVLDLMHNLGSTLHTMDTTEHRRILDLKYKFLSAGANLVPMIHDANAIRALNNEFDEETETGASSASDGNANDIDNTGTASESETNSGIQVCEYQEDGPGPSHTLSVLPQSGDAVGQVEPSTSASRKRSRDERVPVAGETVSTAGESPGTSRASAGQVEKSGKIVKPFKRPKLYTLNPLNITTRLLSFTPKSQKK